MIPYNRQSINEEDIESVVATLKSNYLTQGEIVPKFEEKLCEYTGSKYSVAVSSGTAALHLAFKALGVGKGDIVWSPAISFVASTNAALYCQAEVRFVDIELNSGCICADSLSIELSKTDKKKLPKVLVVVDYSGYCPDLIAIKKLSKKYGFKIIEDACHAFGGEYNDKKIGISEFSDITIFSFHAIKTITTGEGGALMLNDDDLYKKIIVNRSHGIIKDYDKRYPWLYEQVDLGYNYRMTEFQAALGISQLSRIESFIEKRKELLSMYEKKLSKYFQFIIGQGKSSYHLCSILLGNKNKLPELKIFFEYMSKNDVQVQKHYIPIYKQPYYVEQNGVITLPNTEQFYERQVSLPLYVDMTEKDVNYVIDVIENYRWIDE